MKILAIQGSNLKKLNIKTDTTILLAAEAQKKGYKIFYFEPKNISFLNGKVIALCKHIKINNKKKKFYSLLKTIIFSKCILFFLIVFIAFISTSHAAIVLNPAFSNPISNPIAPEKKLNTFIITQCF